MKPLYKMIPLLLLLIAGCQTTKITSSWRAPDMQAKEYKKILVLALINNPDRRLRESMEDHLTNDLRNIGYDVVTSHEEFGPGAFTGMTEAEALGRMSQKGIDGVLTIVLLDKEKERYYVPGRVYYSPYFYYQNRFWGYYSTMYSRVYSPGYYVVDTKYFWETNFYEIGNGQKLLYSVQSQSFEPGSAASLGHEYGQLIVNDMVKRNMLMAKKEPQLKPI